MIRKYFSDGLRSFFTGRPICLNWSPVLLWLGFQHFCFKMSDQTISESFCFHFCVQMMLKLSNQLFLCFVYFFLFRSFAYSLNLSIRQSREELLHFLEVSHHIWDLKDCFAKHIHLAALDIVSQVLHGFEHLNPVLFVIKFAFWIDCLVIVLQVSIELFFCFLGSSCRIFSTCPRTVQNLQVLIGGTHYNQAPSQVGNFLYPLFCSALSIYIPAESKASRIVCIMSSSLE